MMDTSPHSFESIVQQLTGCGKSRTWSIIVTMFGDLAQNPDDEISGPLLSRLTQLVGVKPQAMRVALHRLRRDGWIVTEKFGRTSKHRLSKFGLNKSIIASPKIYAKTVSTPEIWHVLIANPEAQVDEKYLVTRGYRKVLHGVFIGAGMTPQDADDFLTIEGDLASLPEWLGNTIADATTVADHSRLKQNLGAVETALENGFAPTVIETAVIRTLIVHDWRRIVLRQSDLSLESFPQSLCFQSRENVWQLLERLERPTLVALEAAAI